MLLVLAVLGICVCYMCVCDAWHAPGNMCGYMCVCGA